MDKPETRSQNTEQGQMESNPRSLHTPGPWFVSSSIIVVGQNLSKIICNTLMFETVSPMGIEEASANANLISAAPELLQALRPFAKFACEPPCDCNNCFARDVIAKAEGAPSVPNASDSSTASY